jgi:hypothetical protein
MTKFHTIIGMPSSGKTTFLAALWHLITAGELDPALTLDHMDGDYHYLNGIVETWQKCDRLPRTSRAEDNAIAIHLKDTKTAEIMTLDFADLSGETFHSQFVSRHCSPAYVEGLAGQGGIILFVNADRPHDAVSIMDAKGLLDGTDDQLTEWTPEFVAEQAQLVDLLRCMQQSPFELRKRRLALVISAWDIIASKTLTPEQWLETEMSFLAQFLRSNTSSFEVKVYGVSAQGGVVEGETKKELLSKIPSKRIRCIADSLESSDLTLPLKWLSETMNA